MFTTFWIPWEQLIFPCYPQCWDEDGKYSHVIHNFEKYMNIPLIFTMLGYRWEIFPCYSQLWELHEEIFP